jgi:hypothetical protein
MKRASFLGFVSCLGAVLGAGCDTTSEPVDKSLAEQPTYIEPATQPTTTMAGYAWDPEAFFLSVETCKAALGGTCPIPPLLAELTPLYNLAVVAGSPVVMLDPLDPPSPTSPPKYVSAPTPSTGLWSVKNVPARDDVPYLIATTGLGSLNAEVSGGLPPVAAAPYLPTVTLRPFFTGAARFCPLGEAIHMSDRGVLEAVSKYRSSKGAATVVPDFLNPAKFLSVSVFWMYGPAALPNLLFPLGGSTMKATAGTTYNIAWARPGTMGSTQSSRGFYVDDKSPASPIGVSVVVVETGKLTAPVVTYTAVDTVKAESQGRPFVFQPLPLPPSPGTISAASLQFFPSTPPPEGKPTAAPPSFLCLM